MHEILLPDGWKRPSGYSNGVVASGARQIFLAGQVGWNADQQFTSDDFVDQVGQALRNVRALLDAAEAGPEHVVRMTWYVTDRGEYLRRVAEVGATYRDVMGKSFPPMTLVEVSALVEERALVEIEVTAVA
ncbi:MAG: RidA family protein [Acidobacteria bacterium]|nr:MAG: RidA family protein [Acidobacteriota bacterium]REK11545.1 MAG: RidA family protein [Acidobacteriota bacterium]